MKVKANGIYRHFKGNLYKVLFIGYSSINEERMVIYQEIYNDNKIWVRPYDEFVSLVDKIKYPNVNQKYRFEYIDD